MKFAFTLLPACLLTLLACVACAVNSVEQDFLCPVCGTRWEQRIETSGRSRGLRFDLRQLGDVTDPPTMPQCSKCRFPLFSDQLLAQANDPTKAKAFRRLRSFVLGADFQMLAAKNPSYFALAQVQELLGAPHRVLALSYLRASWQAENRDALCRRFLEKALGHYAAALGETDARDSRRIEYMLLCGEIERRLEKWDDAEKRFRELESSGVLKGTQRAVIPAVELRLIGERDSAPHAIEDTRAAAKAPGPIPEIRIENTGSISMGGGGKKDGDAKPDAPAKVLGPVQRPSGPPQSLRLDAAPAPDAAGGITLATPSAPAPQLTLDFTPAAPKPPDAVAQLPPPLMPLTPLGPMVPLILPLPAAKQAPNFSDSPD